jgi:hypothetical protein
MTQPNRDLEVAGWSLQQTVAVSLTAALQHVQRELSILDGYSSGTPEVAVRASADLTGPERYAHARWELTEAREQLRDAKTAVLVSIRDLSELCATVIAMRAPKVVVKPDDTKRDLCCSHQQGKHAAVEWGDPLCMMTSFKAGLCQAHYMAWFRARVRDNIDVSKDHQPL